MHNHGFDWNVVFNAILAFFAIAGFIISLYFSRKSLQQAKELNKETLKQTEELYKNQRNIQLFERRYNVIKQIQIFFRKCINSESVNEAEISECINNLELLLALKADSVEIIDKLITYLDCKYNKKPLPYDYTAKYEDEIKENYNVECNSDSAYCCFALDQLNQLIIKINLG